MAGMKVSISLPEEDLAFLDEYATRHGVTSRSSVIHEAITMLRSAGLEDAYAAAWHEWDDTDDAALWETTSADGLTDAPR